MGVREAKVEKYLNDQVNKIGGITRKWVSPGKDGVPDRIVIINGRVVFVEVKTVDGVRSTAQVREHERLKAVGASVLTLHGKNEVDDFIKFLEVWTK